MSGGPESDTGLREGSLADIDLPRTFAGIFRSRGTGVLHAVSGSRISEICFLDGLIADALANVPEAELGAVLLRGAKVSAEHLKRARDTLQGGQTLGDRLVQLGYLSLEDRAWAETERVRWVASDLLAWGEGKWRFHEVTPAREVAGLRIAPQDVVVRAAVARVSPGAALEDLGGEDAVLSLSDEDLLAIDGIEVAEELDYLLTCLDGRRTLGEAIAHSEAPVTDALPFLGALHAMGLLQSCAIEGDAAPIPPEEAGPEADELPAPEPAPAAADESASPVEAPPAVIEAHPDAAPVPATEGPARSGRVEIAPGAETPAVGSAGPGGPDETPSLVGEVMSRGTVVEVLFSLALLAAVFVGVLYMGRHYLAGLRGDMDETQIVAHVPAAHSGDRPNADALPPGSAARVLSEVAFRYADVEPEREEAVFDPHLRKLLQDDAYRTALSEFQSGNYGQAALLWDAVLAEAPESGSTVLLSRVCTPEEIRARAEVAGPGFLIVSERDSRSRCFQVIWGVFPEEEAALRAVAAARGGPQAAPNAHVVRLSELP